MSDEKDLELDQEARELAREEGDEPEEEVRKVKITIWASARAIYRLSDLEGVVRDLVEEDDMFVGVEDVSADEL